MNLGPAPVAWRIEYACGHNHLTDSFDFVGSWKGGSCQKRGCSGEYDRHVPLYEPEAARARGANTEDGE